MTQELPRCARRFKDKTRCDGKVKFANTELCEDCWAESQEKYHGRSQRVSLEQASFIRFPEEEECFDCVAD